VHCLNIADVISAVAAALYSLTLPAFTGRTRATCQADQDPVSIDRTARSSCSAPGQHRAAVMVVLFKTYCQARACSQGSGLLLQLTDAKSALEHALHTGLREVQHGARQLQHTAQHGSKAVQRRLRSGSEQVGSGK